MKEIWELWHPQGQVIYRSSMISVTDDDKGLTVELSNEKYENSDIIKINFYSGALSYTLLYGAFIEKLRDNLIQEYGKSFFQESSCFKIRNSSYVEWASLQSYEMIRLPRTQHFCIFTSHMIVHAITGLEPRIEFR